MPHTETPISSAVIAAARELSAKVSQFEFAPPVSHVYNPLAYAWAPHEIYLRRFAARPKKIIFVGMNPGPFGMVQCGVPFGEVAAVAHAQGRRKQPRTHAPRGRVEQHLRALLEPAIIVVMGAMVATIILAILLPILQLQNLTGL